MNNLWEKKCNLKRTARSFIKEILVIPVFFIIYGPLNRFYAVHRLEMMAVCIIFHTSPLLAIVSSYQIHLSSLYILLVLFYSSFPCSEDKKKGIGFLYVFNSCFLFVAKMS